MEIISLDIATIAMCVFRVKKKKKKFLVLFLEIQIEAARSIFIPELFYQLPNAA